MMEFLTYDLKVAVLIAVFYMFYRLLLSREKFHRVNRIVLLGTAVASFVLPLCIITLHKTVVLSGGDGLVTFDNFSPVVNDMAGTTEVAIINYFSGKNFTMYIKTNKRGAYDSFDHETLDQFDAQPYTYIYYVRNSLSKLYNFFNIK